MLAAASSRLTEREDVEALVRAVQRTREIIATGPIASTVERELLPGEGADIAASSETRQTNSHRACRKVLRTNLANRAIAFAETFVLEGIAASIGSVGDAYDNALAETTIGLFKTEAVGRGSPFLAGPLRIIDDLEYATMEWVDWFNNRRLHSVLDYLPPEEYEAAYYAQTQESQPATPQP